MRRQSHRRLVDVQATPQLEQHTMVQDQASVVWHRVAAQGEQHAEVLEQILGSVVQGSFLVSCLLGWREPRDDLDLLRPRHLGHVQQELVEVPNLVVGGKIRVDEKQANRALERSRLEDALKGPSGNAVV